MSEAYKAQLSLINASITEALVTYRQFDDEKARIAIEIQTLQDAFYQAGAEHQQIAIGLQIVDLQNARENHMRVALDTIGPARQREEDAWNQLVDFEKGRAADETPLPQIIKLIERLFSREEKLGKRLNTPINQIKLSLVTFYLERALGARNRWQIKINCARWIQATDEVLAICDGETHSTQLAKLRNKFTQRIATLRQVSDVLRGALTKEEKAPEIKVIQSCRKRLRPPKKGVREYWRKQRETRARKEQTNYKLWDKLIARCEDESVVDAQLLANVKNLIPVLIGQEQNLLNAHNTERNQKKLARVTSYLNRLYHARNQLEIRINCANWVQATAAVMQIADAVIQRAEISKLLKKFRPRLHQLYITTSGRRGALTQEGKAPEITTIQSCQQRLRQRYEELRQYVRV